MRTALLVLLLLVVPAALCAEEKKKKVAVIDLIDDSATIDAAALERATAYLWDRIVAANAFTVIARDRQKEAALVLRKESFKECYDKTCNIQLAQRLAADTMLETRITFFGGQYTLSMSLTDLAKVAADRGATAPFDGSETGLRAALDTLVPQIASSTFAEKTLAEERDWRAAGQELVIVEFTSATPGATVTVDGKLLCSALPCRKNIAKGKHALLLQAPHYLDHAEDIAVSGPDTVARDLKPDFALLTITTIPAALPVEIDRRPAGVSPVKMRMPPGLHRVMINSPCHLQKGMEFALTRGEERAIQIVPAPRTAGVSVISEDSSGNAVEAPVIVDGQKVGNAPGSFTVPLCSKKLVVIVSDDDKFETDLNLKENITDEFRAVLKSDLDAVASDGHAKAKEFADKQEVPKVRPYLEPAVWTIASGIVATGIAAGLAVGAMEKFNDYQDMTSPATVAKEMVKPSFNVADYQSRSDKVYKQAEAMEYTGIALFAVGGAAVATGIILMCITEDAPKVQAAVTPDGVYIGWKGEF